MKSLTGFQKLLESQTAFRLKRPNPKRPLGSTPDGNFSMDQVLDSDLIGGLVPKTALQLVTYETVSWNTLGCS